MPVTVQRVLSQNITLVYDSLDLSPVHIDRNHLRQIVGENAMVMDTSEMIVAAQPVNGLFLQLGDRRIRITVQQPSLEIGTVPIWQSAQALTELVSRANLIAYGFNFDVLAEITRESEETLSNIFLADREKLEQDLKGTIESLVPRVHFRRDTTRYDFVLEPQAGKQITAHLNVHLERNKLPHQNALEREYKAEFREFVVLLDRILG